MKEIKDHHFEEEVLKAETLVLVDFFTTWCAPCRLLIPRLEELDEEYPDITFVKLDIDTADSEFADSHDIKAVPTLMLYQNGEELSRKEGMFSKPVLKEWLEEHSSKD